jgi:uncharacterized repeat protein (TIGR02543 family)
MKKRKGVSLIELVLTIAILSMVIQLVYSLLFAGKTSYSVSTNIGFAQQSTRLAGNFISEELRYASTLSDNKEAYDTDFYSISKVDYGDTSILVKTKYIFNDNGTPEDDTDDFYDEDILKTARGNWENISIIRNEETKLGLTIRATETSGGRPSSFELPIKLDLVNIENTGEENAYIPFEIDLSDGDYVYYRNSIDTEIRRRILIPVEEAEEEPAFFILTFDTNGGDTVEEMQITSGNEAILPIPIREGYAFVGWNTKSDGSGVSLGEKYTPVEDVTLYAVWTVEDELLYTFRYLTNEGVYKEYQLNEGDSIPIPSNPTKEGHIFDGWNPEIPVSMPADSFDVLAMWKSVELNGIRNLNISSVQSKNNTITPISGNIYVVGNQNDVTIKIEFKYGLDSSRIDISATGLTNDFAITNSGEDYVGSLTEKVPISSDKEVTITVRDLYNPTNFEAVKIILRK